MTRTFKLVENFNWVIQQLDGFDDPNVTYSQAGRKDLRGGKRIIHRHDQHMINWQEYNISPAGNETILFGLSQVPVNVDTWKLTHSDFKDDELKEKYPKPAEEYKVMVTSKRSFYNGTAKRYYVSCSCTSFLSTFKEIMAKDGYTNDDGIKLPNKGIKKISAGICKHIYLVIAGQYKDILAAENGAAVSASVDPTVLTALFDTDHVSELEPEETSDIYNTEEIPLEKESQEKFLKRKQAYEQQIRKTLKFLSNNLSNDVKIAYKDSRSLASDAFKKYKFSVKKYPQGYVIVFSNPSLNVFSSKESKSKEVVPIFTKKGTNLNRGAGGNSPVIVYSKYFSRDELMRMIQDETKPIQQNQIDYLTKRLGGKQPVITESLSADLDLDTIASLLLEMI